MSRRFYEWDVDDDTRYDLVINTAAFTCAHAADVIADIYRSKYPGPSG